ncbi:hypothetical protein PQX77_002216 [Marasmius sp. AFHP31]|nr:hypothetical protein PQX77_002216 [Marasmius sp. AFHP31]
MVTPRLPERFLGGKAAGVEGFTLGLPSNMTTDEQEEYGATKLTFQEGNIWTSRAYDLVNALQNLFGDFKVTLGQTLPSNKEQHQVLATGFLKKDKLDQEGLLWLLGSRRGLNQDDSKACQAFEETGDRISWTQQQAEVYRKMEAAWQEIAASPEAPTNILKKLDSDPDFHATKLLALKAHAQHQAAVWGDIAQIALVQYSQVTYPDFFDMDQPLHPQVETFRKKQFQWADSLGIQRADLVYGTAKAGTERSKPATK